MLAATFVDEGLFGWDTPVIDIWPAFQAPGAALTHSLRVRDLMGNGSGVAESPTIEFFISGGDDSALDILRSVAYLPVIAPPDTEYSYNNTLFSVAGFLGPILQQTPLPDLVPAYAALLQQHVFDPVGMADAAIAADPRPLGDDWAGSYTRDLFNRLSPLPFSSIDGVAPAGAGIASATDMARYLIMQMNGGVTAEGRRIVSAAALEETHRPGIAVPPDAPNALPALVLPDTTAMHYCQGWFDQTFRDGRQLLWHAGGIDGAASFMGFFPAERIGFVMLTNIDPAYGALFNISIQSSLLSRLFGLNTELPAFLATLPALQAQQKADLAGQTGPVDGNAAAPYLGLYETGFRLRLDAAGSLWLEHDIRSMPLLAHADGGYVVADGPGVVQGKRVRFAVGPNSLPVMTIEGFDPVRWLTGP
jgi:CubicO group peptidase (beta-lactamase class C family)